MRGRHARTFRQRNKGFTLVEMIVTLVGLSIMLSLSVFGLLAWQDWADFNRENEYAQILYIAAQNQLTEFAVDGRLEELQDSLSGGNKEDLNNHERQYDAVGLNLTDSVSSMKDSKGEAYALDTIYPESAGKTNANLYQDEIVSLRAETGDYGRYLNDPEGLKISDPEAYWVFELLGAYVYDASILNGSEDESGSGNGAAICVEITPENGQVFSVLYSDKNDGFIYLGMPKDKKGTAEQQGISDIADRTESYRKDRMVGYYGVDTLYAATKNEVIQPSLSSVKLYNKDTFYMTYRLSAKYRETLTSQLTYKMDLDASKDVNDKKLTITLDGTKLKNEEHAEAISCPVSRYDADGNEVPIGEFPVLAWVEKDYTIHVVLDAADIQATTELYARELSDIRSDDRAATTKFAKTYSFFRFGVEADNVYASVTASGAGFTTSKTISNFGNLNIFKNQGEKHTVFAGESEKTVDDKTAFFYTVKNARHLYNIRYIEDLTYLEEAGGDPALANQIGGVSFTLKSDIDWDAFQAEGSLYNSECGNILLSSLDGRLVDANGNDIGAVTRYNCDFPSISQVRTRDVINGNDKTITGISTSEISNALYGIYISEEGNGTQLDDIRPTGFVNVNYGEIKNLKLDKVMAFGSDFVGGFCGINAGEASGLETKNTKEQSLVTGKKHVGGIIGFQIPTAQDVEIKELTNRAQVEGVEAVGGILGMIRNNFEFSDIDLQELPGLTEQEKQLLANPASLTVKIHECKNYGAVFGVNSSELKGIYTAKTSTRASETERAKAKDTVTEPRYIGGIVGYCYNQDVNDTTRLTIENCTSSPQYNSEKLLSILSDEDKLNERLKGAYVGGIVGYNYFGQINNSSTKSESGQEGYLFGYRYVGGIVGFNIGPASGIVGSDTTKQGENNNHVIAYEYAGGITGCNANVRDVDSENHNISGADAKDPEKLIGLLVPDAERSLHVKIDNWVNKGIVIAVHAYSGGITGYNAGYIYRCNSDVKSDTADTYFATLYSGDYAGGIAGYNNGVIGNTEREVSEDGTTSTIKTPGTKFSTVCYVKGHNYVGGIVGYNDVDSIVEDYEIASGYVLGDEGSCFVGGYAGLNASVDLLMNTSTATPEARFIYSNPNRVEGDYFVGGNIGGNIINMADNREVTQINGVFKTDNFLGILDGKAFVGGFVGYNLLFDNLGSSEWIQNDEENYRGGVYVLQKKMIAAFEASDRSSSNTIDKLREKKEIVDDLRGSLGVNLTASAKSVYISGQGAESTKVSFGTISGEIYVGGVMGYNDDSTNLYIQNVENATAIEAVNAIMYSGEQVLSVNASGEKIYRTTDYIDRPMTYTYSYAGGIIGKVGEKTTLDNCWNAPSGTVTTKGTYTGGLCEINEGTVKNCAVSSFGSSVQDYVGGLCGLNKGVILSCRFTEKTVSGRNVVGGIAAENFGTIKDITLENPVLLVEGKQIAMQEREGVAGIYTGYNGAKGHIILQTDIQNVSVESSGRYVGSVVGVNEGRLDNLKSDASGDIDNLIITGTVYGYQTVGGLIGLNRNSDVSIAISGYTNQAAVTAINGNSGGIIGENRSANSIRNCINEANVTASDAGNAGGITAYNNGLIISCRDYQTVSAPEGMCGGIVALNGEDGEIRSCYVESKQADETLTFRSTRSVGAVAAQNAGYITGNILKNVLVTNETTRLSTSIGIVVGDNLKTGVIELADSSRGTEKIENCEAAVQSNYCKVGGIAGTNAGMIQGTISNQTGKIASVVNCSLTMDKASIASMGGAAGENTGIIKNIAVDAEIQGNLGSAETGYGGIAGYSGYRSRGALEEAVSNAESQDEAYPALITNCTFDGKINATGSSGAPVRVGGITGINAYGSKIENCYIGVRNVDAQGNPSDLTFVTAGDYVNKTADSVSTTDTKSYANLGGIAGDNYGFVSACDNAAYSTESVRIIGFAGETGGIVGYNYEYGIVSGYLDEDDMTEHYLSTGKKWTVEQRCSSNDRGPGGIIGKSVSAEDMSYVKNYAPVTCDYKSNSYVGGLIGVLGQQYDLKTKFYKCENYGKITSYSSASGMVGMLESNGTDFDTCTNWGYVEGKDTSNKYNIGGFIARHYSFTVGADFRHCANHGKIYGNKYNSIGGFIGYESDKIGTPVSHLYDCVNTGIIQRANGEAVQNNVGSFVGRPQGRIIMELCRNYNTQTSAKGFVGSSGDLRFKNCLDNSGIATSDGFTPFGGGSGWSTNMFYLDSQSETTFSHKNYGVYFSFHEGTNGDFRYANQSYRWDLRDPSFLFAEPDKSNKLYLDTSNRNYTVKQLNIGLSYDDGSDGIDSLVVYLWNGSDVINSAPSGNNSVTATFVYSDGTTETLAKQTKNGTYDVTEEARVVFKNPSDDKFPVQIKVIFDNQYKNIDMRGICYIPAAESATNKEVVCTYLGDKTDTTFNISTISRIAGNGTVTEYTYKDYKDSVPFKVNAPKDVWYCYPNDAMDIDWTEYSNYRLEYSTGDFADITFDVNNGENATGMDAFVFYLSNNNTNSQAAQKDIHTYYYEYSVTFTDVNGNSITTDVVPDAKGYDPSEPDYREKSRQVVNVPEGLDSRIASVQLHIKTVKYTRIENGTQKEGSTGYIYFRGFGWIPEGSVREEKMAAGKCESDSAFYDRIYANDGDSRYMKNIHLKLDERDGKSYVYLPYDYDTGFSMENNPIDEAYYADVSDYTESLDNGSRIVTYEELDPKFLIFSEELCTVNKKLAAPSNLSVKQENGCLSYEWKKSPNAYAYEVSYDVVDDSGQLICPSHVETIGSLQLTYSIEIDNAWSENGYHVRFRVRALNAYHFAHDDADAPDYDSNYEQYDSDWTELEQNVKKALPMPEIHMEVVAGNRMTFVLDNYDDYVEEGCTDCTIVLKYKGTNYNWDVQQDGKYRKPVFVNGSPSSPVEFNYYAEPKDSLEDRYTSSAIHSQRGEGHGNDNLRDKDYYCTTDMYGFFGTQADAMEFQTVFTLDNNDSYLMTDITAYDEAVGATVVYDSEITHAANSYGSGKLKLTSTLKNLPKEWFSEDKMPKITARAYPYRSQFDIIHYGHDVAEGIHLDGTVEENRAVLAGIYDEEYFSADSDVPGRNCIWDLAANDLKSGYLLQKQEDGSYNIYYSAVIEMSQTAAAERRSSYNEPYREYYKYDVYYRIYSDMAAETSDAVAVNSVDFQESYWSRDLQNNGNNYNNVQTNTNDRRYVQEIQPAPIVEENVLASTDENGHASYTFTWDKYYQDTACAETWRNSDIYRGSDMRRLTVAEQTGLVETWDAYYDKLSRAGLDNMIPSAENSNARGKLQLLMNMYYNSYSTASYRVDLIGTTLDGKEVILDTITVDAPTSLGTIDSYMGSDGLMHNLTTRDGTTSTTYNMWDYECTFVDSNDAWGTYPKLTARVMRLGSLESVKPFNGNPKTDGNGAVYRLPRYTDKSLQVKLKMNRISKPNVTLLKDNGQYITDDLVYEVGWGAITEERQKDDLGGYLITVKVQTAADAGDVTATHYYYVRDVESGTDTIGLDLDSLSAQGVVTDVTDSYTRTDNACKARINLADFNTRDIVDISVKAIARTNAEIYEDGPEGVSMVLEIPARLKVPNASKLTALLSQDGENLGSYTVVPTETTRISMQRYNLGFAIQYATGDYSTESTAEIALAIAVYDSKPLDAENDRTLVSNAWDAGAVKTIYAKDAVKNLGKASDGNRFVFDLTACERYPGEYAGKWLKIAMRATSATKIDSQWSDQDPDGETINYVWIPVPKLQLDDVELVEGSKPDLEADENPEDVVRYYYDGTIYNELDETLTANQVTQIATKTLCFAEDKNVDGYRIRVTGKEPDVVIGSGVVPVAPIYDLYLQRHIESSDADPYFDGTWDVYLYMSGMPDEEESFGNHPTCEQNGDAIYLGRLGIPFATDEETGVPGSTEPETYELLNIEGIYKTYTIANTPCTMTMQLRYVADADGKGRIQIVLPDITKLDESDYDDRTEYFTTKAEVSQYVKEGRPCTAGRYGEYVRSQN